MITDLHVKRCLIFKNGCFNENLINTINLHSIVLIYFLSSNNCFKFVCSFDLLILKKKTCKIHIIPSHN